VFGRGRPEREVGGRPLADGTDGGQQHNKPVHQHADRAGPRNGRRNGTGKGRTDGRRVGTRKGTRGEERERRSKKEKRNETTIREQEGAREPGTQKRDGRQHCRDLPRTPSKPASGKEAEGREDEGLGGTGDAGRATRETGRGKNERLRSRDSKTTTRARGTLVDYLPLSTVLNLGDKPPLRAGGRAGRRGDLGSTYMQVGVRMLIWPKSPLCGN